MRSFRIIVVAWAVSFSFACKSSGTGAAVPSLTRPGPIAFACFDETTSSFTMALSACAGVTGASSETKRMIGFVLETTRGEVGAIDWQSVRAIDSDRTVPGYTFVRVGESPSAIVIPESDSRMTFVANYGSFSVQSLETAAFVPEAVQDTDGLLQPTTVVLPSGPTDLAYIETPTTRWLFAALPDVGTIAQIPVGMDGSLGAPVYLAVSATIPASVPATSGPEFFEQCPASYARTPTVAPRSPLSLGATPQPNQLSIANRGGTFELVASDAALPVIHRFTISDAGLTEVAGFGVAVPTVDVAATPLVPPSDTTAPAPLTASEQYVYAIDAIGHEVLVVDFTSGAVLPINVGDRAADRIPYEAPALALALVTPGYDLAVDPTLVGRCDPANAADPRRSKVGPISLRGAFVGVSLSDGTVGIVDLFDLDAQCRGTTACGGTGIANDERVYIRRHRPRIGTVSVDPASISTTLTFVFEGSAGGITTTGAPTAGTGPGLDPIDDGDPATAFCPGSSGLPDRGQMALALAASGDPSLQGQPLICVLDDPVAVRQQRWGAVFEAALPSASGVRGRLVDTGTEHRFETEDGSFCKWGVLGSDDVAAAALVPTDPEFGYGGDMLVVTADVPPEFASMCGDLVIPTNGTSRIRIAFAIRRAYENPLDRDPTKNALVLGDFVPDASFTLPSPYNADPAGAFARMLECFPSLVSYEVRARDAYVVGSSISLPRHRVVVDGTGRCAIDTVNFPYDPARPDSARAFRAMPGRPFIHPQVAFQISKFDVVSGRSASLVFDVVSIPIPLRVDAGYLASGIEFNPADQRFYVVDVASHAVLQYALDPVARVDRIQ